MPKALRLLFPSECLPKRKVYMSTKTNLRIAVSLQQRLGQAGVTRICAVGQMTSPEAGWHHDGRFSLLDLVRMVDIEASTEREAQRFTRYEL